MQMDEYLIPYKPPTWAEKLKVSPKYRVSLANSYTPIMTWNLPGVPQDFSVHIKREDMNGSTLSGNKCRTTEFLLADAIDQGYKDVVTCGDLQSNHCRTTAIAAQQLGLQSHLLIFSEESEKDVAIGCKGNILLNRLIGASLYIMRAKRITYKMKKDGLEKLFSVLCGELGAKAYYIPPGGCSELGMFGYFELFKEMMEQNIFEKFDDLIFPCGSGCTMLGMAIANYLTGSHFCCHAILITQNRIVQEMYDLLSSIMNKIGIEGVKPEEMVDIIGGYHGPGYGLSSTVEREFLIEVATKTGIILDSSFNAKAARAMIKEVRTHPERFKGKRLLYLNTGGLFELFTLDLGDLLDKEGSETNKIRDFSFDQ